ncbi:hypothetical protein PPGU19_011490 [Paraburkholderia sp. PGU19]|uniref:hypothetical protein n=1 Tax=Paraburkholderia sp. PGU19 TaxID=2735434 RepID=UPI0015DB90B7|nr:hypothetical protein [Paraburkholderia sp. PGU19]BCF96580.1 hypothetical protein PPGU19_011490 [Paraburkholderia sp. PGU19]
MNDSFEISAPQEPTEGDYLSFTILDGDRQRPGRITGTALALLSNVDERREVFLANFERIRQAAYLMCQENPNLDVIILDSESFQ